ncbi:MAG TPA: ABC transporter ATP-binding protein [Ilumatobacter sp.]|nr:ABC transporter ATP-binding protein [Ilumatobacter sp.]
MKLWRLLRSHLRPYRGQIAVLVVLQALQAIAMLMLPSLSADLIDRGVIGGDKPFIWRTGGVMLAYSAAQVVLASAAIWVGARVAMGFSRDVRRDLFQTVTAYSAREVGAFGAPSLITRITNDVAQVQILVVMGATMMLAAPITMVAGIIMAVRQDVGLSVVFVVAIPVVVVVLGRLIVRLVPAFQAMQARIDDVNRVLREQITGVRVVRAFVREPEETRRFAEANAELTDLALRSGRLFARMFPTVGFIVNAAIIAAVALAAPAIERGDLQVGSLIAYQVYLVQILMSVVMLTFLASLTPRAAVAADRIVDVLDTEPSVRAADEPVTTVPEPGTVEFRNVGFAYPGAERAVLTDVSFRVTPGTTTAVIGSTGSGKTTVVNLVVRLFDATSGSVLVNGVDVRALDPTLLWGHIGYVPQRAFLFAGTVASNLRFGRPDATDAELWRALEIAQAAEFVRAMPDGLDSEIDQGGTNVSGGQRQRLAIARALVVRPQLYVFDDSFSALDLSTDARLRAALAPYTADAAVIIVAQRVSTIRSADQIVVLDDGRIVGVGTHEQLVATCAEYAEIVESQHASGAVA